MLVLLEVGGKPLSVRLVQTPAGTIDMFNLSPLIVSKLATEATHGRSDVVVLQAIKCNSTWRQPVLWDGVQQLRGSKPRPAWSEHQHNCLR
eukprot:3615849-Pyramimonas_sp.AAC.1